MNDTSEKEAPDVNRQLAQRLRDARSERGWSLDRTAQETGVSKAMLGQIERGKSSPTVATLWKIATGFRCSLSSFLAPPPASGPAIFRNADAVRARPASDPMLVAPLFPFEPRVGFEWLELTLAPGYTRESEPHAPGVVEHIVVIENSMEVLIEGEWHRLQAGDAVRFAADRPHGYRNSSDEPALCHNLIHYPAMHGQDISPAGA
ncbi:MAG: XRE family transcriptional regulator [Candidatus Dactylopiibacterium carminicum]|nr:XRE family transcriptional regulator [Candidatus Dactylopiibacterium carminicum]PAS96682.1 MAG: XRE family transcriptional regulator [Candidatus Dactylopiibacterium carminicum]